MNSLTRDNVSETNLINEFNPKISMYLESDIHILSPLFKVRGVLENQAAANYVMTVLIKAYKVQSDTRSGFATNAVIKTVEAFKDSTKSEEAIDAGIKECERLSLIKHDSVSGEITMFSKCFKATYVL